MVLELVRKINNKIVKVAEELAKKYRVQYEASSLIKENKYYKQSVSFIYECKVNREVWRTSISINYIIYKNENDYRIKILIDNTQVCDRKLKNLSFKEIERKIRDKLDKHLSEIIENWKRQENIRIIENEIAQIFEVLGVKPEVRFYDSSNSYYAEFKINKNISIVVSGSLNNNELSINSVEIVGNDLTNKLEQIAEIYKAMIAFL